MNLKVDYRSDYGYIALLVVFVLYLGSMMKNFSYALFGNSNLQYTGKFLLQFAYGPIPLVFFLLTVATIVFIFLNPKLATYTGSLVFVNKIFLHLFSAVSPDGKQIWRLIDQWHFQTLLLVLLLCSFIAYLVLKPYKYKANKPFEISVTLAAGLYFLMWLF